MSDLISRKDVSYIIKKYFDENYIIDGAWYADGLIRELSDLPSAEKTGKWIDDDFVGQYRCSECDYYSVDEFNYCPDCGAKMEGEVKK